MTLSPISATPHKQSSPLSECSSNEDQLIEILQERRLAHTTLHRAQGTAETTLGGMQPSPLSAQASELRRVIRRNRSMRTNSSALMSNDLSLKVRSLLPARKRHGYQTGT